MLFRSVPNARSYGKRIENNQFSTISGYIHRGRRVDKVQTRTLTDINLAKNGTEKKIEEGSGGKLEGAAREGCATASSGSEPVGES